MTITARRGRRSAAFAGVVTAGLATVLAPAVPQAAAATSRCGNVTARPWCDTAPDPDRRAAILLQALTQDEEITLLGGDVPGASPHTGATFAIPRLGLPAVYFSDGPVGPRQGKSTAMPIPMALAAGFDPALARAHGAEIAQEAKAKGNDVIFAPTVNILRTPQGGRSYEAYGEEPFLVGQTAVGWITGAQGEGLIADVKHYAANNQEGQGGVPPVSSVNGGRMVVNAVVDERTLREVYFPHFEAAVKQANVGSVMCSYNRINGPYACESAHNLQQVLEKEWGFNGFVLSDYGAAHNTIDNLNHGLDFEPSGTGADFSYNPQQIQAALASGQVTKATLDAHVRRILRTFFAFGTLDRPAYVNNDRQIDKTAHAKVAEQIAEQGITLLKNTGGALPLDASVRSLAVIGPFADSFITGGGSGSVVPFNPVSALAGLRARTGKNVRITYLDGSDQAAAAAAAKAADAVVLVVGDVETEGQDKDCIGLNCTSDLANSEAVLFLQGKNCTPTTCPLNGRDQDGLITAVAAANPRTVVVMETGAPVLTPWRDQVPALLEAWYPGQNGGTAIARVLYGDVDPGGRLPATFPASADQLPTAGDMESYPGVAETETYKEGLLVGYRWYDAKRLAPAFPFGAGLSYTTFRYSDLRVATGRPGSQQVATATVTVTNTGRRVGTAVPQLYLAKPASAALPQPVRQLAGYAKTSLKPGERARVTFPLNDRSFASWSTRANAWTITPGCYTLTAGASSRELPTSAVVGRGASCPGAPTLAGTTAFTLPLPAPATAVFLAAPAPTGAARMPAAGSSTSRSGGLARTGGGPWLPFTGLLLLMAWLLLRRLGHPAAERRR